MFYDAKHYVEHWFICNMLCKLYVRLYASYDASSYASYDASSYASYDASSYASLPLCMT